ncbi:MAG: hypothetical protein AAGA21_12725 [Pseudomonadota bacterium]
MPGFWRSAIASFLFVGLLAVCFFVISEIVRESLHKTIPQDIGLFRILALFGLMSLILNAIPDFISIIQTRFILMKMNNSKNPYLFLILDLLITFLIPFLFIKITSAILGGKLSAVDFAECIDIVLFRSGSENNFLVIFIYSTFLTSVWIWLYAFGDLLVDLSGRIKWMRRFLAENTLLEDKPLSVMGWLIITTITMIFGGYIVFMLLMPD